MAANGVRRTQVSPPVTASADKRSHGKQQRNPSRKALQSAIQDTTAELSRPAKALRTATDNVYMALRERTGVIDESTLHVPRQKYKEILTELEGLYAKDKWGDTLSDFQRVHQSSQSRVCPDSLRQSKNDTVQ